VYFVKDMPLSAKISILIVLVAQLNVLYRVSGFRLTRTFARNLVAFPKTSIFSRDSRLYLELSDILDDDSSEFLEALRRQMDGNNILNASPREITNRIKGFFAISKRSPEEILHFKKVSRVEWPIKRVDPLLVTNIYVIPIDILRFFTLS
jgi:hypothetical protein